jgi:hypothetical protein
MLKLINGDVEVLNKDIETQAYPICDRSGYTIGTAETYKHALEIKKAVGNHNDIVRLLAEVARTVGKRNRLYKKVHSFMDERQLLTS